MSRFALAVLSLSGLAAVASAQDMPLFSFTKSGEGWVKADGKPSESSVADTGPVLAEVKGGNYKIDFGMSRYRLEFTETDRATGRAPLGKLVTYALTADGSTIYVGFTESSAVWAYSVDKDNKLYSGGAPYAPLRIRKGYDNSKDALAKLKAKPPTLAVTALTLDTDGRIYAGTPDGVQVFDPTGRLCGVLLLPAAGQPTDLSWDGEKKDTLVMWLGEQKWARRLNATGLR